MTERWNWALPLAELPLNSSLLILTLPVWALKQSLCSSQPRVDAGEYTPAQPHAVQFPATTSAASSAEDWQHGQQWGCCRGAWCLHSSVPSCWFNTGLGTSAWAGGAADCQGRWRAQFPRSHLTWQMFMLLCRLQHAPLPSPPLPQIKIKQKWSKNVSNA